MRAEAERKASSLLKRESGILLHPTSLPGPHGIGDLGAEARGFVDFLHAAGQGLWQVLPLGPTGLGNSPYMARSALAGNPLLISLEDLLDEGFLAAEDLANSPGFPRSRVDFEAVESYKLPLLKKAYREFRASATARQRTEFECFCAEHAGWLDDFALFMALREAHRGLSWIDWERDLVKRDPEALADWRKALANATGYHRFVQYVFFGQWDRLKRHANRHGVRIVGDIPIFVALDSADVWARQELFYLADDGRPTVVAGVPPDYFSPTGQLWGNPLYRWVRLAEEGYRWWVERFRATLSQVDLVRIDHFRGFGGYWEVPGRDETAEHGCWREGPGIAFFRALEASLGTLPVIAEDLGLITPDVVEMRLELGYPGMKVLQFAFDSGPDNPYLPHNYERTCVVYTGTHDNNTTVGWFKELPRKQQKTVTRYAGGEGREIHWDLLRLALTSVGDAVVVPIQDVLGLDEEARMNTPGRAGGNWAWRLRAGQIEPEHAEQLREFTEMTGRCSLP